MVWNEPGSLKFIAHSIEWHWKLERANESEEGSTPFIQSSNPFRFLHFHRIALCLFQKDIFTRSGQFYNRGFGLFGLYYFMEGVIILQKGLAFMDICLGCMFSCIAAQGIYPPPYFQNLWSPFYFHRILFGLSPFKDQSSVFLLRLSNCPFISGWSLRSSPKDLLKSVPYFTRLLLEYDPAGISSPVVCE